MEDLIWAGIRAMVISHALKVALSIGVLLGWFAWGIMAAKWRTALFDKLKRESNLESLLDTPMKRETLKMEGNTTYCYPQDEGPLTRICPLCGALYPSYKVLCYYDNQELQPFKKPITEPLSVLPSVEMPKEETLEDIARRMEEATEKEIQEAWTALENKAYEYGRNHPYTFSREEVLNLCILNFKLKKQSQKERRAS